MSNLTTINLPILNTNTLVFLKCYGVYINSNTNNQWKCHESTVIDFSYTKKRNQFCEKWFCI